MFTAEADFAGISKDGMMVSKVNKKNLDKSNI